MREISIRPLRDGDIPTTAQVFFDAVHHGAARHYDDAQRAAWAPALPEASAWRARLAAQTVFVAERDGDVIGFMTLTADGCIDLAYVAPAMIGCGVAKALYDAIAAHARGVGLKTLTAEASHQARAFFERQGWHVVTPQNVRRRGVAIPNFAMKTTLA